MRPQGIETAPAALHRDFLSDCRRLRAAIKTRVFLDTLRPVATISASGYRDGREYFCRTWRDLTQGAIHPSYVYHARLLFTQEMAGLLRELIARRRLIKALDTPSNV